MTRTKFLVIWLGLMVAVLTGAPGGAWALDKVKVVIPQDSVFVLNFMGGRDAGIFSKHGIDVDVDARPFAGFLAGLPSKQCFIVTYSGLDAIQHMNEGVGMAIVGGGLTVIQDIYVPKDSPIKTAADLRGKRVGVWSTGAGAYKATRIALKDATGIDLAKDTKLTQVAAPALFKMLQTGQVDAMINVSSFTIAAASQPDKFRTVFSPNDYWKKKTGYPVFWAAPTVAWKSWIDENPTRAKNMANAIEESFRWLRKPENLDATLKKYGQLAGVTTPAAAATYKKMLGEDRIFLAHWDQKVADSQWKFLEIGKKEGILDKVPPEKDFALLLER